VPDLATLVRCTRRDDGDLFVAVHVAGRGQDLVERRRRRSVDHVAELRRVGPPGPELPRQSDGPRPHGEDTVGDLAAQPVDGERHPFTAPAAIPDTIWRWKKMNMTSGGIVISSTSANSRF
jgi:hypothetical protein